MNKSDTIGALAAALAKAQGQMTFASKDATNPHFRAKYADLAAIVDAIRGPLSGNGLAYSQLCDFTESGGLIIETVLMHESGEWISGKMQMPVPKNDPQGIGSATTYGKRYGLAAIVGIAADEDDDGEAAMGRGQAQQQKQQQKAAEPPPQQPVDPKDAEYHERIKVALKAAYGDDKQAALNKVEELTTFTPKGKTEPVKGVRNYLMLKGDRAKILAHNLEKLVPKEQSMCNECRQVGTHAPSCPNAEPPVEQMFENHKNQMLNELKKDMQQS